jgi:2-polyprenyl-3-methyl-5-hydroxy-6-metoxy-1,4-benzoquinol methylase/uncharacterized protein YbaR (Trm112 family)
MADPDKLSPPSSCGMHHTVLLCPKDLTGLTLRSDGALSCQSGHRYPVIDGVPVLLRDDIEQTMDLARASMSRARGEPESIDARNADLYLESLGISEAEKNMAVELSRTDGRKVDPVISVLVAATNGIAYKHLVGSLSNYPIPNTRLPQTSSKVMLDIGCNWGRWSIASARKGYRVVGIDPSLGAIMAAKRVAKQLGLTIDYICADARHLPFRDNSFDTVFSYSVIQHFSKDDAVRTFMEIGRILKPSGNCLVQMPNYLGIRNLVHLFRRNFAEGSGFEVRYWGIEELQGTFEQCIGPAKTSIHCYFGLGLEPTDSHLMPRYLRWVVGISEGLRKLSTKLPWLANVADSVYVSAVKLREGTRASQLPFEKKPSV